MYSNLPGRHRPDPAHPDQVAHAPRYGALSKLFAVTERHELEPPPALGSTEYKRGVEDVRGFGIAPHLMGTLPVKFRKRINDETLIGLFWA